MSSLQSNTPPRNPADDTGISLDCALVVMMILLSLGLLLAAITLFVFAVTCAWSSGAGG